MSAARDAGIRRVIFASSAPSMVLPTPLADPRIDDSKPSNPYAVSKLAAEHYVRSIGELYRIETVMLRIFNAMVRASACPLASACDPTFSAPGPGGGSIVLHGNPPGSQTRDFIYVDDVVDAMLAAGKSAGFPGKYSILAAVTKPVWPRWSPAWSKYVVPTRNALRAPSRRPASQRMCADIRAASDLLDWRPRISLEAGLGA